VTLAMPLVAVLAAVAGGLLGFAADRLAVRWPEHDPEEPEHPPGRPIGWRTLVVVAVGAAAFGLLPGRLAGDPLAIAVFGAWFATLVVGLATDLDQRLLPDVLTLPVIPVALIYAVSGLNPFVDGAWLPALGVALAVPLVLFLPSLLYGAGAFGVGDVKLLVGAGLLLGLEAYLGGVVFGLLLAGIVLAVLLVARRIGRRTYVPFGPFLILGALWAVLILPPR
jgi:leader peptidase (prepilin peptidase)/N-methyltransferase